MCQPKWSQKIPQNLLEQNSKMIKLYSVIYNAVNIESRGLFFEWAQTWKILVKMRKQANTLLSLVELYDPGTGPV